MKAPLFVFLGLLLLAGRGSAQPAAAPVPAPDAAKVADFQRRFAQGSALENQGDLAGARTIYQGILAEQSDAKGSLLGAGRTSLALNDPRKADAYLDQLHALVPEFPGAIELLIQANEALHREVKAERLVREYRTLHDSGKIPQLSGSAYFPRERISLEAGSEIMIFQYFDYTKPPYCVLNAELFDAQHHVQRGLLLKYDPEGTQQIRAKDPKLARDEVFTLLEPIYTGDQITTVNVYQELLATPEYGKVRALLLGIFSGTSKPIYSGPPNAAPPPSSPPVSPR